MEDNKAIERLTVHLKIEVDGSEMEKLTEYIKSTKALLDALALKSDITFEVKVSKPECDLEELRKSIQDLTPSISETIGENISDILKNIPRERS